MIRGKNIIDIKQKLSEEVAKLNVWLIDNKLSLHLGKTESPLFASTRKLKQQKFIRISCNGIKVGGKKVVTYLGGQLDPDRAPLKEVLGGQYNYREGGQQVLQQGA